MIPRRHVRFSQITKAHHVDRYHPRSLVKLMCGQPIRFGHIVHKNLGMSEIIVPESMAVDENEFHPTIVL